MSSSLFQFQFDVVQGATLSARIVDGLFRDCTDDDLQALVFPPLELLGQWLMVAGDRIRQGEVALRSQEPSWFRVPMRAALPSVARSVARSMHLTSTFLFAVCCTVVFEPQKAGELIHEIMRLKGHLIKYNIASRLVCDWVEIIKGNEDFLPKPTPFDIYDSIAKRVWGENHKQKLGIDDFYNDCGFKQLAQLIVLTLDALQDSSCRQVHLEGSKTGIFIATIFAWLRPDETAVLVGQIQIYPETQSDAGVPRLLISLSSSAQTTAGSGWKLSEWREVTSPTETFAILSDPDDSLDPQRQHSSPWRDARYHLESRGGTSLISNDVGHLAAALVNTITECGTVWIKDPETSIDLMNICSRNYLNIYPHMMEKFGWNDLNTDRVVRMSNALASKVSRMTSNVPYGEHLNTLGRCVESCYVDYEESHGEPMLLSLSKHMADVDLFQHAVNLAGQAIASSLWLGLPIHRTYRPLEQNLLNQMSKLITDILSKDSGSKSTFWELRQHSIRSAIPNVDVGLFDLACAGGGYVAYTSILAAEVEDMTDQRLAGCIQIRAGCLKWKEDQGRYTRLVAQPPNQRLASRSIDLLARPVKLFTEQGVFDGIAESESQNKLDISISNSVQSDYSKRTISLWTQLEEPAAYIGIVQKDVFATNWPRSIGSVLSATHVRRSDSRLSQLRSLAEDWMSSGHLGNGLQWCHIGRFPKTRVRHITTTGASTELRFFEAGNVSEGRTVIIRQGDVPLMHCVKIAMEQCGDNPDWVIIA